MSIQLGTSIIIVFDLLCNKRSNIANLKFILSMLAHDQIQGNNIWNLIAPTIYQELHSFIVFNCETCSTNGNLPVINLDKLATASD